MILLKSKRLESRSKTCLIVLFSFSGYARIVLAILSFYFMPFDYVTASICYIVSGLLDAFDGHAARMLNQGKLGFLI